MLPIESETTAERRSTWRGWAQERWLAFNTLLYRHRWWLARRLAILAALRLIAELCGTADERTQQICAFVSDALERLP